MVAKEEITPEKFYESMGRHPEDDDLERCNCPMAGEIGHQDCGWNYEKNKPQFVSWEWGI